MARLVQPAPLVKRVLLVLLVQLERQVLWVQRVLLAQPAPQVLRG